MKLTLQRFSKCIFNAPTLNIEPRPDSTRVNASSFGPRCDRLGFSSKCKKSASSPVSGLFSSCCPLAIGRLVISLIIDALNTVFWRWSWPHVGHEVFKTSPPATNFDPTATIVFEGYASLASTTGIDQPPNAMFGCPTQFMCNGAEFLTLPLQAPAASCVSSAKPFSRINLFVPAFAKTKPLCASFFGSLRFERNNLKPAKCLAVYVLERVIHMAKTMTDMPVMSTLS